MGTYNKCISVQNLCKVTFTRECEFLYSRARSHYFPSTPEFFTSARTRERSYSRVGLLYLLLASAKALTREYQICYSRAVTRESFTLSAMYMYV